MSETYDITYDGAHVGNAKMKKQGLYYTISCRCCLPDAGLYRIHAIAGGRREDLGICVPMGDAFGMDKMIPVKYLGEEGVFFELHPKDWLPEYPKVTELTESGEQPEPVEQVCEPPMDETEADNCDEETFIPVQEEEPFDYLDRLEDAVLAIRDDQIGIVLSETE